MSDEEIRAYVFKIESMSFEDIEAFMKELPNKETYNFEDAMKRICDGLQEDIRALRRLNNEQNNENLDDEILDNLKRLYLCNLYLDRQNTLDYKVKKTKHQIIFAKTSTGKPYFNNDLSKVPTEAYAEVKKVLFSILYGVNKGNGTKAKYFTEIKLPKKVFEFKGFQVRIYTTKLKGNILCVFGLKIKKDNNPKSIHVFLDERLKAANKQIEDLKKKIKDADVRKRLLLDSQNILDDIINVLNKAEENTDFVFPSDEELQTLVSNDDINDNEISNTVVANEVKRDVDIVPVSAKVVKKRTRGLGKKTIARNKIMDSLKPFNLEELKQIQNYINILKKDKELNDVIGNMYEGFLSMSDEQVQQFEEGIKYFKNDDVGRHK